REMGLPIIIFAMAMITLSVLHNIREAYIRAGEKNSILKSYSGNRIILCQELMLDAISRELESTIIILVMGITTGNPMAHGIKYLRNQAAILIFQKLFIPGVMFGLVLNRLK